jgi:hypothetical protein
MVIILPLPFLKVTCREGKTFAQIYSSAIANSEILGTTLTEIQFNLRNGPIQTLKISECGDYVVLSHAANTTVVKIPSEFLELKSMSLKQLLKPTSATTSDLVHLGSTELAHFGLQHGQTVTNPTCHLGPAGEPITLVLEQRGGDRPSIQLTQLGSGNGRQTLELLALPLSNDVKHTAVTALMPNTEEGSLRLIVNSRSRSDYSMKDDNTYYPALIERNVTSIMRIAKSDLLRSKQLRENKR